jgi:hypothetical protein
MTFMPQVEGQHDGEWIVGEVVTMGDIARASGTLAAGASVVDGQIVGLSGGDLVSLSGEVDTAGNIDGVPVEGIVIGDWDASTETGDGADIVGVPYIKHLCVVDDSLLTYPTETTAGGQAAAVRAQMDAKFLIRR